MTEQTQQPTIKLELTIDEVNAILASLGKHPFEAIFSLVNKIQQQAIPQVPQPAAAPEAPAA
jgi:hypothetical protein